MTKIDQHLLSHTRGDVALCAATYMAGFFLLVIGIRLGDLWALGVCTPIAALLMFAASAGLLEAGRVANAYAERQP